MLNSLRISLIVAVATASIACQNPQGPMHSSDPLTPTFSHKPGHAGGGRDRNDEDVGTFRFTFSGPYLSGVIGPFTQEVTSRTSQLVGNGLGSTQYPLAFSDALLALHPDGETCFADPSYSGGIVINERRDGDAGINFQFEANGTDGLPLDNTIWMKGTFDGTAWPPAIGGSNTITGYLLAQNERRNQPRCAFELNEVGAFTVVVKRLE